VQEWFLSSRDRLKKRPVLTRATCECSSRAPIVLVLLQLVYSAPCTAPRCSLHSSKGRPAWSPSMLLVAAVAAAAVALSLSSMWQQQSSLLPRKQASRLPTHWPQRRCSPSSAALSLIRSLCTLCNLAASRILSPPATGAYLAERRQQLPARCALTCAAVSRRRKAQAGAGWAARRADRTVWRRLGLVALGGVC
jgi:hypothetical protein